MIVCDFVHTVNQSSEYGIGVSDSVRGLISAQKSMGFHLGLIHRAQWKRTGLRVVVRGIFTTEFFPNTNPPLPIPPVLTELECIRLLRLDEGERGVESARRAFRRLVDMKRVRPARVGLRNRYLRDEILRFVRHQTELAGQAPDEAR